MSRDSSRHERFTERWDRIYDALSAEPRRRIIFSLLDEPRERRLPLPDAAESPNTSIEEETLRIQLLHRHLPKLAEVGYVSWEREPFCVQRGPHFEEPALVLDAVVNGVDEYPERLLDECEVLREETTGSSDARSTG